MTKTVLEQVMTRQGPLCGCTGQCGKPHGSGKCYQARKPGKALVAAPADPALSDSEAARVPVEQLIVWCPACLTPARKKARQARAEQNLVELADAQLDLFPTEGAA